MSMHKLRSVLDKPQMNSRGNILMPVGVLILIVLLAVGAVWGLSAAGLFSLGTSSNDNDGVGDGSWANQVVKHQILSTNRFTGSTVDPSHVLYEEEPESCWDNPRSSCDEVLDGSYSSSAGTAIVNNQVPGKYYIISTLSGYYTQFNDITIPSSQGSTTLTDYNANPGILNVDMEQADTLSSQNFTVTVSSNVTGKEYSESESFDITDDYCYKPWKIDVTETANSLSDYGTQISYEGVKQFQVYVQDKKYEVVDLTKGVTNGFDGDSATQKYTIELENEDITVCDNQNLDLRVFLKADTRDSNVTADQKLGNGEVVATMVMYDAQGTASPTFYVQGADA